MLRTSAAQGEALKASGLAVAESLRLELLGDFRVRTGTLCIENTEWDLRKAKNLVKLLALEESFRMHREQIMDLLWPTLSPEAAANNLHKALYIVRRTLEPDLAPRAPSRFLHVRGDWVQLEAPGGVYSDAQAFAATAKSALATKTSEQCADALALYAGDLLPEDRYEDWVIPHREHLRALRVEVLVCFARVRAASGRLDYATALLEQAAAIDPLNEEVQGELIHLYGLSGQRHLAVQQYKQLVDILGQELGVEPDAKTRELMQRIVEGESQPAPSRSLTDVQSRDVDGTTDSLPLFGRETEVARAQEILDRLCDGESGVLVVRGEDGIGKSQFTVELARYAEWLDIRVIRLCGNPTEDDRVVGRGAINPAGPILVIIDDPVDLAGAVQTAQRLAAEWRDSPVLVVTAIRTDRAELDCYLEQLRTLSTESACSWFLDLGPLDDSAVELLVRRILGGRVPRSLINWMVATVGGNPHCVREAVQSLIGRDLLYRVDGRWELSEPPRTLTRDSLRRPPRRTVARVLHG